MRKKSQALDCFKEFVALLSFHQHPFGPGSRLQSDNDSCYDNAAFHAYVGSLGGRLQFSAPYRQAESGIAERNWRTLVDSARTLLRAADLPKPYWGLALLHAAYMRNRMPSSAINNQIPLKVLTNIDPDYSVLHELGTPAYVHVEKSNRKKWDDKARTGIYVGRDEHSNADRVYFADTNRVVTSANVVFNDQQRLLDEGVTTSDAPTSAADDGEAVICRC